jgi:hypothetical protein
MRERGEHVVIETERYGIGYADAGRDLAPRAVWRHECSFGSSVVRMPRMGKWNPCYIVGVLVRYRCCKVWIRQ